MEGQAGLSAAASTAYTTRPVREPSKAKSAYNGLSKRDRFLLHLFILLNLVLAILLPLVYFKAIPMYLQYRVSLLGTGTNAIRVHRMAVGEIKGNTVVFNGDFRLDPLIFIPVYGAMGATTIHVLDRDGNGGLMDLHVPEQGFWTHREMVLQFECVLEVNGDNQQNLREVLRRFSEEGLGGMTVRVQLDAPVLVYGVQIYKGVPLYRDVLLDDYKGQVKSLLSILNAPLNPNLILVQKDLDNNSALIKGFGEQDIFMLGGVKLIWKSVMFEVTDTSFLIDVSFAFENGTPLELARIDYLEYYLTLQGKKVVKMSIEKMSLESLLNSDFEVRVTMTFLEDGVLIADQTILAMESASEEFARENDFAFGLIGPVSVRGADFINAVTHSFNVNGRFQDLVQAAPEKVNSLLKDPRVGELVDQIQSLLGRTQLDVSVSDRIDMKLNVNLPVLDFVIPPKSLVFPYRSSMSIYGKTGVKVVETQVSEVTVARLDGGGFTIDVGLLILFTNTEEAARDFALGLNPVLKRKSEVGQVGLKAFKFMKKDGSSYRWCEELFGKRVLGLHIPPLDKSTLDFGIGKKVLFDVKKVVSLKGLDIHQSRLVSGYQMRSVVDIGVIPNAIKVKFDLPAISFSLAASDMTLLQVQMGRVNFNAGSMGVPLSVDVVVAKGVGLSERIQGVVDLEGYLGLKGLSMGSITAFSNLVIEVDSSLLYHSLTNNSTTTSNFTALTNSISDFNSSNFGRVRVEKVKVELDKVVSLSSTLKLINMYPVTLQLFSTQFTTTLNTPTTIQAIELVKGEQQLDLGMTVGLAALKVTKGDRVAVRGLVLGRELGLASIDQFEKVSFYLPTLNTQSLNTLSLNTQNTQSLNPKSFNTQSIASLFDISPLIPKSVALKDSQIKVVDTTLTTDLQLQLDRIPVTIHINNLKTSLTLNNDKFIDLSVTLDVKEGLVSMKTEVTFGNSEALKESLRVGGLVGVGGVSFGDTKIQLDTSLRLPPISTIALQTPSIPSTKLPNLDAILLKLINLSVSQQEKSIHLNTQIQSNLNSLVSLPKIHFSSLVDADIDVSMSNGLLDLKTAILFKDVLDTELSLTGFRVGGIRCFEGITLTLPKMVSIPVASTGFIQVDTSQVDFQLTSLDLHTLQNRLIDFQSTFDSKSVTVQGLAVGMSVALDDQPFINVNIDSRQANQVNVLTGFPKINADRVQECLAQIWNGDEKSVGRMKLTGLTVGGVQLIKAPFVLPTSSLSTLVPTTLNPSTLPALDFIELRRVMLQMRGDKVELEVATKVKASLQVDFNYFKVLNTLNSKPLVELSGGLKSARGLDTLATAELAFKENVEQKSVDGLMGLEGEVGVTGVVFGYSASDYIDTFANVNLSFQLAKLKSLNSSSVVETVVKPMVKKVLDGVKMRALEVDVKSESELSVKAEVQVVLPFEVQVDIPFFTVKSGLNNGELAHVTMSDLSLKQNTLNMNLVLSFADQNDVSSQEMFTTIGNIFFHRHVPSQDTGYVTAVSFGTLQQPINIFKGLQITTPLSAQIALAIDYFDTNRPFELLDIQSVLGATGVETKAFLSIATPFLNLKASLEAAVKYQVGNGPITHVVQVPVHKLAFPVVEFTMVPDTLPFGQGGTVDSIAAFLPLLTTFKDFTSSGLLGFVVLTGSNGAVFRCFEKTSFRPGIVSLWEPLVIDMVPTWPFAKGSKDLTLPVKTQMSFLNGGPLHLDAGLIEAKVMVGEKMLMELRGSLDVRNVNEGGNVTTAKATLPTQGTFEVVVPLEELRPSSLLKVVKLLLDGDGVEIVMTVTSKGKVPYYMPNLISGISQSGALAKVIPLLGLILAHVRIEVFNKDITSIPVIGTLFTKLEKKLVEMLGGTAKSSAQKMLDAKTDGSGVVMLTSDRLKIASH